MRRTDVSLKAFIFGCEWVQVDPFHAEKNVRLAFTEVLFCSSFSSMFVCVHKCEQRHTYIPFSLVYIYMCVCVDVHVGHGKIFHRFLTCWKTGPYPACRASVFMVVLLTILFNPIRRKLSP